MVKNGKESFTNGSVVKNPTAKAGDTGLIPSWWKILKEMAIPDHLTCLLRNLYAGQEATVMT